MPILPFTDPMFPPPRSPETGGGFPPQSCQPHVVSTCEPITFNICSCVNQGYAPPSGWVLLMAVAGDGVFPIANGSVSYNSSDETVTLNNLPESYMRSGGSWSPLTTLILGLNCTEGCNNQELAIWDNYGEFSTNPPLIQNTPVRFTTNTFPNRCCAEDLVDVSTITTKQACDQAAADNPNSDNNIVWQCTTVQAERCTERLETTFDNTDTAGLLRDALGFLYRVRMDQADKLLEQLSDRSLLIAEDLRHAFGGDIALEAINGSEIKLTIQDFIDDSDPKIKAGPNYKTKIPDSFRTETLTTPFGKVTKYDWIMSRIKKSIENVDNLYKKGGNELRQKLLKARANGANTIITEVREDIIEKLVKARRAARKSNGGGKGGKIGAIGLILTLLTTGSDVLADLSDGKIDDFQPLMDLLQSELSMGGGCSVYMTDENGNTIGGEPDPDMEALRRLIEDATKDDPTFKSPRSLDDIINEYFGPDPAGPRPPFPGDERPSRSQFFIPKPNSQPNIDMNDRTMTVPSQNLNNQLLNNNLGSPLKSFPSILAPLPNPNPFSPSEPYRGTGGDLTNDVYNPRTSRGNNTGHDLGNDVYIAPPKGRI